MLAPSTGSELRSPITMNGPPRKPPRLPFVVADVSSRRDVVVPEAHFVVIAPCRCDPRVRRTRAASDGLRARAACRLPTRIGTSQWLFEDSGSTASSASNTSPPGPASPDRRAASPRHVAPQELAERARAGRDRSENATTAPSRTARETRRSRARRRRPPTRPSLSKSRPDGTPVLIRRRSDT